MLICELSKIHYYINASLSNVLKIIIINYPRTTGRIYKPLRDPVYGRILSDSIVCPVSELYTEAVIVSLGVVSDFRRRGVASRLMRHVITLANRDSSIARIRLDVHKNNFEAIKLYEKMGFQSLCLNKADEWIMIKHTE